MITVRGTITCDVPGCGETRDCIVTLHHEFTSAKSPTTGLTLSLAPVVKSVKMIDLLGEPPWTAYGMRGDKTACPKHDQTITEALAAREINKQKTPQKKTPKKKKIPRKKTPKKTPQKKTRRSDGKRDLSLGKARTLIKPKDAAAYRRALRKFLAGCRPGNETAIQLAATFRLDFGVGRCVYCGTFINSTWAKSPCEGPVALEHKFKKARAKP